MDLKGFLTIINEHLTFFVIFPGIALLGMYLSVKLNFLQFSKLKMSFACLLDKGDRSKGNMTHYQAVSAVLAGNFGTGNISGMAIALSTGGPGALVWMWIIAFLGSAIQYSSCVLGVKYRKKTGQNEYLGGPMYYLTHGLKKKYLGIIFSLFMMLGALTVGNFTQVNSISLPLEKVGIHPLISGVVIAFFVGLVILGGVERFAKTASSIVPVMAFFYFGSTLLILGMNFEKVLPAFWLMFKAAFAPTALFGGTLGYGIIKTLTTGFDRGIFATDAGTGIVPILQSSAQSKNPVVNGIITLIAPVFVMIVCSATGLVLIVTGAWQQSDLQSTNMVIFAFQNNLGKVAGEYIVLIALLLFSYTTVLAWAHCGEKATEYLFGKRYVRFFQWLFILMVPLGSLFRVDLVWLLADISISLMLSTNMIGVASLSKEVIAESKEYFRLLENKSAVSQNTSA